jgi:hypothetical protein
VTQREINEHLWRQQGSDLFLEDGAKSPHPFQMCAVRGWIGKTPLYVESFFEALMVRPTGRPQKGMSAHRGPP